MKTNSENNVVDINEEIEEMEIETKKSKFKTGVKKYGKIAIAVLAAAATGVVGYALGKKESEIGEPEIDTSDYYLSDSDDVTE